MELLHWRSMAAESADTDVLDALSFDDDIHVRASVAKNEATEARTLIRLAGDGSRHVVLATLTNKSLPLLVRQAVVEVTSDLTLAKLAVIHALPEDREGLQSTMEQRRDELAKPVTTVEATRVHGLIAESKNADTKADRLAEISREQNVVLRRNVAKHPNTAPSTLSALASDADRRVRNSVALHAATSLSTRKTLARNEADPNVVRVTVAHATNRQAVAQAAADSVHPGIAAEWQLRVEREAARPTPQKKATKVKCPTPDKTAYAGKAHALGKGAFAARTIGRAIRAYPCPCGSWHHTTRV